MSIRKRALEYAITEYPDNDRLLYEAFANSVTYYVTGKLPMDTLGPSIREHLCSWSLAGDGTISTTMTNLGRLTYIIPDGSLPRPGEWSFTRACEFCAPIVFGPLPMLARRVIEQESFYDDTREDLIEIKRRLVEELNSIKASAPRSATLSIKRLITKVDKALSDCNW